MSDVTYAEVDATAPIKAAGIADLLLGPPDLKINENLDWEAATFAVRAGEHDGEPAHTLIARFQIKFQRPRTEELELNLERGEVRNLDSGLSQLSAHQQRTLQGLVQASQRAGVNGSAKVVGH